VIGVTRAGVTAVLIEQTLAVVASIDRETDPVPLPPETVIVAVPVVGSSNFKVVLEAVAFSAAWRDFSIMTV
jgi:hypothetical protein